jgi:hypothetical protein
MSLQSRIAEASHFTLKNRGCIAQVITVSQHFNTSNPAGKE